MAVHCFYGDLSAGIRRSYGVSYEFCPPDNYLKMTNSDFDFYGKAASYTGDFQCLESGNSYNPKGINEYAFPCSTNSLVVKPVEFMLHNEIEAGYAVTPGVFVMTQEQIDFILTSVLVMTMCIAFCLGFSANESSAK